MTGTKAVVAETKGRKTKRMVEVVAWEHFGNFSNCKKLNLESVRGSQYIKEQAETD